MAEMIWKYPLHEGVTTVPLQADAHVLSVLVQDGLVYLYARVDPDAPVTPRRFLMVYTGQLLPSMGGARFLATVQSHYTTNGYMVPGQLVWHIFEMTDPPPVHTWNDR